MDISSAIKKYKKYVVKKVDEQSSFYFDNDTKSFTYNIYDKVDESIVEDLTDELITIIQESLYDKTSIIFEDNNILGFLRKSKMITFVKQNLS